MRCSRRRKTKAPYCEEDPNCYWDKSCKNKTRRNQNAPRNISNNKLDLILSKLENIESALSRLQTNESNQDMNLNLSTIPMVNNNNANTNNSNNANNANNNANNNTRKNRNKTATIPPGVLLNRANRMNNNNNTRKNKTASANAIQKLLSAI